METLGQSLSSLRHELRTPVNHILGYSELLLEDAGERHLEAFIPAFQQIQSGGRRLLESIQAVLAGDSIQELNLAAFMEDIGGTAAEVLKISSAMQEELETGHRQTLADLDAISWALRNLMEFTGGDGETLIRNAVQPSRRAEPLVRERSSAPRKRRGGKILIADDDPGNRDLLRRRLEFEGHEVVEATNGLEVLELLKDHHCDLVLLDIMMPELDGFQTLARLKQDPEFYELPVIMISALDELRSVVHCIEMGADDYLPKPFNRVLLRARIGASLEKKWLRDGERRKADELAQTLRLLEQAQAQLAIQASQDALTGLANRRSVDAHLEFRAQRKIPFTLIYIDLNGFKKINDTYGHQAGDDLLKQVGKRLRLAFRATDIVGRWGGDEFVALVDGSLEDTQAHVSRVTEGLSKVFEIVGVETQQRVRVGAAVGVAVWHPGEPVAGALQRADADMYHQKLRRVGDLAGDRPTRNVS